MNITYEDTVFCINCCPHTLPPQHPRNRGPQKLLSTHQPFQKISLKKHDLQSKKQNEIAGSQHLPAYLNALQSTSHHTQALSLSTKLRNVEPQIRTGRHTNQKKSLSFREKEKEESRVLQSHLQYNNFKDVSLGTAKFVQPSSQLTKTTRAVKESGEAILERTRKVIPRSQHNLFELSKLKHSAVSILVAEERPRVEQSMIMIDFFHPETQSQRRGQ